MHSPLASRKGVIPTLGACACVVIGRRQATAQATVQATAQATAAQDTVQATAQATAQAPALPGADSRPVFFSRRHHMM